MEPRRETATTTGEVVRLLDKTTRVMQTLIARLDVMEFADRQAQRRISALERKVARFERRK